MAIWLRMFKWSVVWKIDRAWLNQGEILVRIVFIAMLTSTVHITRSHDHHPPSQALTPTLTDTTSLIFKAHFTLHLQLKTINTCLLKAPYNQHSYLYLSLTTPLTSASEKVIEAINYNAF